MGFLEIMENPLLAEHILHQVDALSLSSLQRTSHQTKRLVEAHYAHAFRTLLARYLKDVDGFLYLLRRIDGCITGSQALKVIMNDAEAIWEAKDLDISVPKGSTCILCSYLERFESYTGNDRECDANGKTTWSEERLGYHQILKRQRLKSVTKMVGRNGQKIDILESNTCNCIAPLCEFHSTAVINALFPERITCFFPKYTLRYRSIPNALYQRERDHRSVAKYTGRGWQPIRHAKAILEEEVLLANTWNIDVSFVLPDWTEVGEAAEAREDIWSMREAKRSVEEVITKS
ncbi:hypothetical protein P389DRAFT_29766 [Cystobasidium minutum MCA 4210]|uniref:uncharacterized protein n=1 Tax=Cystobasidium minutum MCA 4210 TaxID=1397322 RepID=UPI0034CDCB8D|eukprot:jgi/Rhomi1/29766/CE29765_112